MRRKKLLGSKGQGSLEYLLLIGGAILIAAVAITVLSASGGGGVNTERNAANTYQSSFNRLATGLTGTGQTCTLPDNTGPTIKLIGNTSIDWQQNSPYVEPGVESVMDDCNGNVSDTLVINPAEADVDTSVAVGTHITITYSAEDKTGNNTDVIRTITIIPAAGGSPPVFVPSSIPNPPVTEATSPNGAQVAYTNPTATGQNPTVTCSPISDSWFGVGDNTVTCTATDAGGTATVTFNVTVQDTTPPAIALNSPSSLDVNIDSQYAELATAVDLVDGTVNIITTGSVDTNKIGIYHLAYDAVDNQGNPATQVTRDVNVGMPCPNFLGNPVTFKIYLLNISVGPSSVPSRGISGLAQSLANALSGIPSYTGTGQTSWGFPKNGISIDLNTITTLSDFNFALSNAPEKSVFINGHGGAIPFLDFGWYVPEMPQIMMQPDWNRWFDFIAQKVDQRKYVWVSTAGYPFYSVANRNVALSLGWVNGDYNMANIVTPPFSQRIQDLGAKYFLDSNEPYSIRQADMNFFSPPGTATLTNEGKAIASCWGLTSSPFGGLPRELPATYQLSANLSLPANANSKPSKVLYVNTANNYQSIEFVKMGNGYFVHIGNDQGSGSMAVSVSAKTSLLLALQAAGLNHQN